MNDVPPPSSTEQAQWNMDLEHLISVCHEDSRRWFPGAQDLPTMVLAMCGEAGEVANLVKKIVRGSLTVEEAMDVDTMADFEKDTLQEEVVDVLIYLCNIMGLLEFKDVNWGEIFHDKRAFNEQRFGPRYGPTDQEREQDEMMTRPEGADQ
jgi:NTP pyrophosphatase (non-canonical NTP hydrolase)